MKNVEYWMGYYVNEFTTPNEIIAHFNLEEGIQSGIHDWNNECEIECEVRTKQEIEIIKNDLHNIRVNIVNTLRGLRQIEEYLESKLSKKENKNDV